MIAPARLAAYETLLAVAGGRADLPAALARARGSLRDERDRALAGEIATGTLRWQASFDRIVAQFSNRDPARHRCITPLLDRVPVVPGDLSGLEPYVTLDGIGMERRERGKGHYSPVLLDQTVAISGIPDYVVVRVSQPENTREVFSDQASRLAVTLLRR